MRLLVLGGTAFVGRHVVEAAVARGHEVTLFNRGQTGPGLFPGLEQLTGDRDGDLSALAGRPFDAVLDTTGYLPRVVRASARLLAPSVALYAFVSSLSVYADAPVLAEDTPLQTAADPASEDVGTHYGALKALCEAEVEAAFPGRTLLIRPGLVVGAHDYTGRFTYWPRRLARGGSVLAPAPAAARVWLIDARDLAQWTVSMIERQATGAYNAVGPAEALTTGDVIAACQAVAGVEAEVVWVDEGFLLDQGVKPYTELPLWSPAANGGFPRIELVKALAAGLTFRPLMETIGAVLETTDAPHASFSLPRPAAGLTAEREQELLAAWLR